MTIKMRGRTRLTDEERDVVKVALPGIRRQSPEAAKIIVRLIKVAYSPEPAQEDPYVSVSDAAEVLGVTRQTVRNWADRGWIPSQRRPGGARRIPRSALASAEALRRPRPPVRDLTPEQQAAIIAAPRRAT